MTAMTPNNAPRDRCTPLCRLNTRSAPANPSAAREATKDELAIQKELIASYPLTTRRHKVPQERPRIAQECKGMLIGLFRGTGHLHRDANQCAIRSVFRHRVPDEVALRPVLAGDDAATVLIPVEDELPVQAFLDHDLVHVQ